MDFSASHAGFVVAAYLISGSVLAALVIANVISLKRLERELKDLEETEAARRNRKQ